MGQRNQTEDSTYILNNCSFWLQVLLTKILLPILMTTMPKIWLKDLREHTRTKIH